jgi:hypothetical protein
MKILCSHGAFWYSFPHSSYSSIDYIMQSTNLVIAETKKEYEDVYQQIYNPNKLTNATSRHSIPSPDSMFPISRENDISFIPIVTTQWVFDTNANYAVQAYERYEWTNELFSNFTFYLDVIRKNAAEVKESILKYRGKIVDKKEDAMFIVCSRCVDSDVYKDERAVAARWIADCIRSQQIIPRESDLLYRPFPNLLNEQGIVFTGFVKADKRLMERLAV